MRAPCLELMRNGKSGSSSLWETQIHVFQTTLKISENVVHRGCGRRCYELWQIDFCDLHKVLTVIGELYCGNLIFIVYDEALILWVTSSHSNLKTLCYSVTFHSRWTDIIQTLNYSSCTIRSIGYIFWYPGKIQSWDNKIIQIQNYSPYCYKISIVFLSRLLTVSRNTKLRLCYKFHFPWKISSQISYNY